MNKRVDFTHTASDWVIANRDFISEDVIISVLNDFPLHLWVPEMEEDCYSISFRRIRRGKPVLVIIYVHNYSTRYLVYKCHHTKPV